MIAPDKPKIERQLWVVEWAKSESFWRDVASRSVAGTIVVGIAAIFAVAVGLIQGRVVIFLGCALIWAALVIWLGVRGLRWIADQASRFKSTKRRDVAQVINVFVGTGLMVGLCWSGITLLALLIPLNQ